MKYLITILIVILIFSSCKKEEITENFLEFNGEVHYVYYTKTWPTEVTIFPINQLFKDTSYPSSANLIIEEDSIFLNFNAYLYKFENSNSDLDSDFELEGGYFDQDYKSYLINYTSGSLYFEINHFHSISIGLGNIEYHKEYVFQSN